MKVGDVVVAIPPNVLACGSGRYSCAIVANLKPFVLVSVDGGMLWWNEDQHDVTPLCQAAPDIVAVAVARYRRDAGLPPDSAPRFPGLNPEALPDEVLGTMATQIGPTARLVESEEERERLTSACCTYAQLYTWDSLHKRWAGVCRSDVNSSRTYATTREPGWWKQEGGAR